MMLRSILMRGVSLTLPKLDQLTLIHLVYNDKVDKMLLLIAKTDLNCKIINQAVFTRLPKIKTKAIT